MGAVATQRSLMPFRSGTRQRKAFVGSVAYAAGTTLNPIELPRVGLLSRVIVQYRGNVTLSGAGALTNLGPWNLSARLQVNANIGSAAIVDLSGYGAYMAQPWVESIGYRPDMAGIGGGTTPDADIHSAPVAMGANAWVLTWILPISANVGSQFELGLVNLQAPETRVTVQITCGALLDPSSLVTATDGSFFVWYEYYEIPDPRVFALPPLALVRTLEEQQPVAGTGDNIYTVPRQGVLLQLAHRLTLNAARSDSWDRYSMKFNKTDTVYQIDRQWERVWERLNYGLNPIDGIIYHDLWHAADGVSNGDTRDAVDAEELSTLESIVTVTSGATLGSNNNFLTAVRRIIQMLES